MRALSSQAGRSSRRDHSRAGPRASLLPPPPPPSPRPSNARRPPTALGAPRASAGVLFAPVAPAQAFDAAGAAVADAPRPRYTADLLVSCADRKGVVAALAQLLYGYGCNIINTDQYSDITANSFHQRIHFDFSDLNVGPENVNVLETAMASLAANFGMEWSIHYSTKVKRMAILVSKFDHCLYDLLIRHKSGELACTIPLIISNHPDLEEVARQFGVRFVHLPIAAGGDKAAAKAAQEAAIEALIEDEAIDLLVLARYMQVLSPGFCDRNARRTVNIHHSFLPAFEGGRPYHRAHERGVKLIGATAHLATSELDAGPIIEQDTARITHRDSVEAMVRKGRDLERTVLARGVKALLENRVIVSGTRTVVFEETS